MSQVLVVDDEVPFAQVLCDVLTDLGHRSLCAHDGRQALERVRADRPALVVVDVMMPLHDGKRFVLDLRRDPTLRDVRVLLMSVSPAPVGLEGYQAFLRKPFTLQAFCDAVLRVLA